MGIVKLEAFDSIILRSNRSSLDSNGKNVLFFHWCILAHLLLHVPTVLQVYPSNKEPSIKFFLEASNNNLGCLASSQ